MALDVCRLLALFMSICSIADGCSLIATCYRCELPSSYVNTVSYVDTAAECYTLLTSTSYKTATYDSSTRKCERGSTDQRLDYDSSTTKVTYRKTCNSDCLTYRWSNTNDREFYTTPGGQTGESRSRCLGRCAETANCRMLHHRTSSMYGDTCGWKTSCGTTCNTKYDSKFNIYKRLCYTGVDCGLVSTPVTNGQASYPNTKPTEEGSQISYSCNTGYEKANSNVRTCMASGAWSTEVFTCNPKDCGGLSDANGVWTYTTTTYTSTASITCNTGYYIQRTGYSNNYGSTESVTCSSSANWSRDYYCAPECLLIATCYRCDLPSSYVNTVSYVDTAEECLTLLTSTSLYKTAAYDVSTRKCERGSTDQHLQYDSSTTKVTYRKTCNSGDQQNASCDLYPASGCKYLEKNCLTYRWSYTNDREFYSTPGGQTGDSRSRCLGRCAEITNCRMLHHKTSDYYGDTCGWKTSCGTTCNTQYDSRFNIYRRYCYTGVDCGLISTPVTNGWASYSNTKPTEEGSQISYSCNTGYEKANSNMRTCISSGNWSTEVFTCNPKDCGGLSDTNGVWTYTTTTYTSTASITCNTGYYVRRSGYSYNYGSTESVTCTCCTGGSNSAYWTRDYYCSIVRCTSQYLSYGNVAYTGSRNYGTDVNYSCNTGYEMTSGDATRTCQASGSWNGTKPTCSKKDCGPAPAAPVDGSVSAPWTTYNNYATYSCNTGYTRIGSSSRYCNSSGLWDGTTPTCQIVDCGGVAAPSNGNVAVALTTYNEYATFTCDVGYNLFGASSIRCRSTGSWSSSVPSCNIVNCGSLSVANGYVTHPLTTYDSLATYTCNTGYEQTGGDVTRICQASGSWNGTQAVCTIFDCGPVTAPINGSVSASPTTYASNANYNCDTGFDIQGASVRTCNSSGLWSNTAPTCQIKDCGGLTAPTNGNVTVPFSTFGEQATFMCDYGYNVNGAPVLECTAVGTWDLPTPTCDLVNCGGLPGITNGYVTHPLTTYGSPAVYTCDTGYEQTGGDMTRICQASGSWNGTQAVCTILDCGPVTPPVNGSVSASPTTYGSNANYNCDTGFDIQGTSVRTCNSTGHWSNTAPTCQIKDCGGLTAPTNGNVAVPLTTFGEQATFLCDYGYYVNGAPVLECTAVGTWDLPTPTCDLVNCGGLPGITNGYVTNPLTTYGGQATYACNTGYEQTGGDETRICQASGSWNGTQAVCTILDCGPVTAPINGSISASPTTYGSNANYNCDTGFDIQGASVRTCTSTGLWSNTAPTCQIKDCGGLTAPTNGNVAVPLTTFGEQATFMCDYGYYVNGAPVLECTAVGTWDLPTPTCDLVNCGGLPGITNGYVTHPLTTYGSPAVYTCDTGYEQTGGDMTRTCQASGSWNGTQAVCTILDCGSVTAPTNGSVSASPTTYGSNANYNCDTGFDIQGTSVRTCDSSGLWSNTAPTCQIKDCGGLTAPTNGNVTVPLTTFGEQATFMCDYGYYVNGASVLTCTAAGSWDNPTPTCSLVDCAALPTITNGSVTHPFTTYGGQATYACNTGYEQTGGDETRICQASGSWNGTQAVCTILDCGSVTAPINGSVSASPTTYASNANYNCDTGFDIQGASVRTCNSSGLWSNTAPTCQIKDCGGLTAPTNGNVTAPFTTFGEQATFMCEYGYYVNGAPVLECTSVGTWDLPTPTCDLVDCGGLPGITNGYVTHPLTTYGSPAVYTCDTGYEISSGDETRTCLASWAWNGTEPTCTIVDCGSPLDPNNGSVTHSSTTYTSVAIYACDPGFNVNGTSPRTCQADKQWSGTEPSCDQFDCGVLPNPTNGSVSINTTLYLGTAVYICDPGNLHVGADTRTCISPGTWTSSPPTCVFVDCGPLTSPINGFAITTDTFYGATANYSCDAGYQLNGTVWTTCNESGNWDPPSVPLCDPQFCPTPANQTNGWVETENGTMIGKLAAYDCFAGYNLNGSSTRECQTDLSWTGTEPSCDPEDCGPLAAPTDGSVSTPGGTVYPEVANYSCNRGYIRSGPSARSCQTDGTWNDTQPTCTLADCGGLSPPVNGDVTTSGGTTYSKTAVYRCDAGFVTAGLAARVCQASGAWSGVPATCVAEDSVPPKIFIAPCNCVKNKTFVNLTQDEIIDLLVKETAINLKNTSSALAKLECADDPRTSSTSLGLLGVGMICLVMTFMFSADCIRICRWFAERDRSKYRANGVGTQPSPQ